jgi:hypothetical protein
VGHREPGDGRQHLPMERLIEVRSNVELDLFNSFGIA